MLVESKVRVQNIICITRSKQHLLYELGIFSLYITCKIVMEEYTMFYTGP